MNTLYEKKVMNITEVVERYKPTVYILRGGWSYGDGDVLATFASEGQAKKMLEFMEKYGKYDWHKLEESKVEEVTID